MSLKLARSTDQGTTWTISELVSSADTLYFPYLTARATGDMAAAWHAGWGIDLKVQAAFARVDPQDGTTLEVQQVELPYDVLGPWGEDGSDKLKRGLVLGVAGLMAIPLPAENRAECEVRLTLRGRGGEELWSQACIGEVDETVYRAATSRDDKGLAEEFLPQAVKRCNACLLGQLRQFLSGGGAP